MKRKVLLIEPNYKNKYPPIGLMKLASYHRMLGDDVRFFKGDLKQLVIDEIYDELIFKLNKIDNSIFWKQYQPKIREYIVKGSLSILDDLSSLSEKNSPIIKEWFKYYSNYYRKGTYKSNPKWDRVCITTLFTFHWKVTVETIKFAKYFAKDPNEIWIGGVLATVLSKEVKKETGITPYKGLLNKKGILDNNDIIIDTLPLDYSILGEIDYEYTENNAYYGYMTRGCVRKCEFCVVWKLEPKFDKHVPLDTKVNDTAKEFGEKRNLLLLDNNVLASKYFPEIIKEIKNNGFQRGSTYIEPNSLEIAIKNLKSGKNDYSYLRNTYKLYNSLLSKSKGSDKQLVYDLLKENNLLTLYTAEKKSVLSVYPDLAKLYDKYRNKTSKLRYVDFNQGLDARLMTEEKMKLLSEISIKPLRIAFDSLDFKDVYEQSIVWAAKYKIPELSNYLLYNFNDRPEELYLRLDLNVNYCEELDIDIFSFPMKYLPIDMDRFYMNRDYIGIHWNRKFLRAVQAILNSTKGKIGRGLSFFKKAFGRDLDEYFELLYMPETYLIYRYFFEHIGYIQEWKKDFSIKNLNSNELVEAKRIIENNDFSNIDSLTSNSKILKLLNHYSIIKRESVTDPKSKLYKLKKKYDTSGSVLDEVENYKNSFVS